MAQNAAITLIALMCRLTVRDGHFSSAASASSSSWGRAWLPAARVPEEPQTDAKFQRGRSDISSDSGQLCPSDALLKS